MSKDIEAAEYDLMSDIETIRTSVLNDDKTYEINDVLYVIDEITELVESYFKWLKEENEKKLKKESDLKQ